MQRITCLAFVTIALGLMTSSARAERYQSESRFGLGLELGAPSGLSGKYFLGGQVAVQGGVGIMEGWYDDGLHVHAEVVWHPAVLHRGRTVVIPVHLGVGGRVLDHRYGRGERCFDGRVFVECGDDTHIGVRAPVGLSFIFNKTPMDLFVELALIVDVIRVDDYMYDQDHDRAGLQGALGGRFYF